MRFPRTAVAEFARKACEAGLMVGSEGNISVRVKDRVYVTPSGVLKNEVKPENIVVVDLEGNILEGRKPTTELKMHLALYAKRQDISAIIHAHPVYTLALDMAGEDFSKPYLAEMPLLLGEIGHIPYVPPGTPAVGEALSQESEGKNVFVLKRHGAVTLGKNLEEALNLMLVLEKVAKVIFLAKNLAQDIKPLEKF
ncbi:class II aldolase/adducin family protein [Thermodesulfatator atlanticus]